MENVKTSIFKQKIFETSYVIYRWGLIDAYRGKLIEQKEIFKCDIATPILKIGDNFYIEELDIMVCIEDVIRTSQDKILYFIKSEDIDTENSLKQKEELENMIKRRKQELEKRTLEEKQKNAMILSDYNSKSKLYKFFVKYEKFKATHS